MNESRSKTKQLPRPVPVPVERIPGWDLVLVALFLCRLLVPAEGVDKGDTLWIAVAWFAAVAARLWSFWRARTLPVLSWGAVDLGVGLFLGGAALSSVLVLGGTGDRRAALNFFWEWLSVGCFWISFKELTSRLDGRQLVTRCLLVTVFSLSLVGIWQHFVWYPQQSRELSRLLELQQTLSAQRSLTPAERKTYDQLRATWGSELLSLEPGSQQMLIARTRDSREPIGRFALANTFAALLIAGWFPTLFLTAQKWWNTATWRDRVLLASVLGVISVCLLLTKSRTAYAGIATGLLLLAFQFAFRSGISRKLLWRTAAVVGFAMSILVVALSLSGGLDWQVLSEAPKSLAYRLEYWQATWNMILDHPLLGVGSGNFRQHYFAYKLPGASEEILDPHNMILDAWSNGGLIQLAGLLLLIGVWIMRLGKNPGTFESPVRSSSFTARVMLTGGIAFGLVLCEEWLLEGFLDQNLLALFVTWVICGLVLSVPGIADAFPFPAVLAAGTALQVHLLGAGGIGMPAVLQILLLIFLLSDPIQPPRLTSSPRWFMAVLATAALGLIGCIWSGLVPVVSAARLIDQGRHAAQGSIRSAAAEKLFLQAAEVDQLSWQPHNELAGLAFQQWKISDRDNAELFEKAIREKEESIRKNPLAAKEFLTLSDWWLQRFDRAQNPEFAMEATRAAARGVQLYPNFSPLLAQLARSQSAAGDLAEAAQSARRALELDALNLDRGHVDKVLSEHTRKRLEELISSEQSPPE